MGPADLIVVDTSAVLAVLLQEDDAARFAAAIGAADTPRISAASVLEASIALRTKKTPQAEDRLDEFLTDGGFRIDPVTAEQIRIAREAHRTYGRGTGHPARLNFGDCFAYALAKSLGAPLLFKGTDFARTDIATV